MNKHAPLPSPSMVTRRKCFPFFESNPPILGLSLSTYPRLRRERGMIGTTLQRDRFLNRTYLHFQRIMAGGSIFESSQLRGLFTRKSESLRRLRIYCFHRNKEGLPLGCEVEPLPIHLSFGMRQLCSIDSIE